MILLIGYTYRDPDSHLNKHETIKIFVDEKERALALADITEAIFFGSMGLNFKNNAQMQLYFLCERFVCSYNQMLGNFYPVTLERATLLEK